MALEQLKSIFFGVMLVNIAWFYLYKLSEKTEHSFDLQTTENRTLQSDIQGVSDKLAP